MKRRKDWADRLQAFVETVRKKPFEWGAHDCCTFPADAVLAMTGVDPIADFRGQYNDRNSAFRVINEHGGIEALVDRVMPSAMVTVSRKARRGDVVHLEQHALGARLGVCWSMGVVAPGDTGLILIDLPRGAKTWHVPF